MAISFDEHFTNFMNKYDRIVIDLSPVPLIITYTKDVDVNPIKDALLEFYESLVGYCRTGNVCQVNAQKIYTEKGYPYFYLYDPEYLDSRGDVPTDFLNVYGELGTTIGYTHHVLPYVKFRTRHPDGRIERYRMAVETTLENVIQFYVTKTEGELLEMLKKRYLYNLITVPRDPRNAYWWNFYEEDPYVPDEKEFGGSTKKRRHRKRRRATRNLRRKKNSKR
jgi:hypothetical protein